MPGFFFPDADRLCERKELLRYQKVQPAAQAYPIKQAFLKVRALPTGSVFPIFFKDFLA